MFTCGNATSCFGKPGFLSTRTQPPRRHAAVNSKFSSDTCDLPGAERAAPTQRWVVARRAHSGKGRPTTAPAPVRGIDGVHAVERREVWGNTGADRVGVLWRYRPSEEGFYTRADATAPGRPASHRCRQRVMPPHDPRFHRMGRFNAQFRGNAGSTSSLHANLMNGHAAAAEACRESGSSRAKAGGRPSPASTGQKRVLRDRRTPVHDEEKLRRATLTVRHV